MIISYIEQLTNGNEMMSAGIVTVLLTVSAVIAPKIPVFIMNFVRRQLITTLTLNNTDHGKKITFIKVSEFVYKLCNSSSSRTLALDSLWGDNGINRMVLNIGMGVHPFFYKGKLCWLRKTGLPSSGSDLEKEEITISYFGRSHSLFHTFVAENQPDEDSSVIKELTYREGRWEASTEIRKRALDTLALNPETKAHFTTTIESFVSDTGRQEFYNLGLPYKLSLILHGKPGTGKTSIIRALASDYDFKICTLPLTEMADSTFKHAMSRVPPRSFVLIEDFDSSKVTHSRKPTTKSGKKNENDRYEFLTLSGILNTLDGIKPLDDVILFLTTNCLDDIDDALYRPGRVDEIIELPVIRSEVVKEYFERIFDITIDFECRELLAKDINRITYLGKKDINAALAELRTTEACKLKRLG